MAQRGTALFALAWFAFPLEFVPLQNGWDNSLTIIVYPLLELLHYGTWPQLFHTLLTGLGELIADAGEPLSRALALPRQFLHHLQNLFSFVLHNVVFPCELLYVNTRAFFLESIF